MNMALAPRELVDAASRADFGSFAAERLASHVRFSRERIGGAVLAGLFHLVLLAGILYGGAQIVVRTVAETSVEATIVPDTQKPQQVEQKIQPKLVEMKLPLVSAPTIDISVPTPNAIQAKPIEEKPVQQAEQMPVETRDSYLGRLLAHLNRFKRYPAEAKRARVQGVTMLHFVMNRSGQVLSFEVQQSSGKPALDEEALALVQRAQPLPAIPSNFPQDQLNLIVPIEFTLH